MIPDIHAIVEMLIAKQCTAQQALGWLNTHMENADLRDHFAGLAMGGMISAPNFSQDGDHVVGMLSDGLSFKDGWKGRISVSAYAMADEMLKARSA